MQTWLLDCFIKVIAIVSIATQALIVQPLHTMYSIA